jgi:hypothetical protein
VVTSSILVIASIMHIADAREVSTVPMARQRKMLPRPCPLEGCGRKYGTLQFILFNSKYKYSRYNLTCRIRHYDPQKYTKIANRRKKQRAARTLYKDMWHSFQMDDHIKGLESASGEVTPWHEYFEKTGNTHLKSKTFKPNEDIINFIRKSGWHVKPTDSELEKTLGEGL